MSQRDATKSHSATALGNNDARASDETPIGQAFKRQRQHLEPDVPVIQINDKDTDSSASTETVIESYIPTKEAETPAGPHARYLVSKLDRLHDKKERYNSHRQFLKKCLDNNIIPNGLRLDLEPTIGNHDEEFLQNWYGELEECSKKFMRNVLDFCEKTDLATDAEIKAVDTELKTAVEKEQYDNVKATVIQNNTLRSHELQRRKNRKFHALKYKKEAPKRTTTPRWVNDQPVVNRDTRTTPTTRNQDHSRDERNTQYQRGTIHRNNPQAHSYAAVSEGRHQQYTEEPRRTRSRTNLSRRGSFNNINDKQAPLHEQISIRRQRSFTRREENNEKQIESEITKLQSQLDGIRNNKKTNATVSERTYQFDKEEFPALNQKNANITQNSDMGANNQIIKDAFNFVTNAMETLKTFETKFATILSNHGTLPDRS